MRVGVAGAEGGRRRLVRREGRRGLDDGAPAAREEESVELGAEEDVGREGGSVVMRGEGGREEDGWG